MSPGIGRLDNSPLAIQSRGGRTSLHAHIRNKTRSSCMSQCGKALSVKTQFIAKISRTPTHTKWSWGPATVFHFGLKPMGNTIVCLSPLGRQFPEGVEAWVEVIINLAPYDDRHLWSSVNCSIITYTRVLTGGPSMGTDIELFLQVVVLPRPGSQGLQIRTPLASPPPPPPPPSPLFDPWGNVDWGGEGYGLHWVLACPKSKGLGLIFIIWCY